MEFTEEQKQFFDNHSEKMIEMAYNYDRHEKVFRPDGYGEMSSDCGDTICISLTTMKKVIQHVSLEIEGCAYTNACANAVAELVEGNSIENAWQLSAKQVADYLKSLPESSFHCAEMAVNALFQALTDHRKKPVTKF